MWIHPIHFILSKAPRRSFSLRERHEIPKPLHRYDVRAVGHSPSRLFCWGEGSNSSWLEFSSRTLPGLAGPSSTRGTGGVGVRRDPTDPSSGGWSKQHVHRLNSDHASDSGVVSDPLETLGQAPSVHFGRARPVPIGGCVLRKNTSAGAILIWQAVTFATKPAWAQRIERLRCG